MQPIKRLTISNVVIFYFRYFTGNTKNSDGSIQFEKGKTSISKTVNGVIKIVTDAVSAVLLCKPLAEKIFLTTFIDIQVTIVVVAVPEGLPLAVTLT